MTSTKPTVVYLAGPMSGRPNYNFDEFNRITGILRDRGVRVLNPAETAGGVQDLGRQWYFKYDFGVIALCDAVLCMPEWDTSEGAKAEVVYASEIGVPVLLIDEEGTLTGEIDVTRVNVEYVVSRS